MFVNALNRISDAKFFSHILLFSLLLNEKPWRGAFCRLAFDLHCPQALPFRAHKTECDCWASSVPPMSQYLQTLPSTRIQGCGPGATLAALNFQLLIANGGSVINTTGILYLL